MKSPGDNRPGFHVQKKMKAVDCSTAFRHLSTP
jgi:hypothetical protein